MPDRHDDAGPIDYVARLGGGGKTDITFSSKQPRGVLLGLKGPV
jgi:hypothetical protein